MIKRLVIESGGKRKEIVYSDLSMRDINSRIRAYERKYGTSFSRYSKAFSCDDALPDEMTDVMDWEYLIAEKASRLRSPKKERVS
jgi:hypothetical protein